MRAYMYIYLGERERERERERGQEKVDRKEVIGEMAID